MRDDDDGVSKDVSPVTHNDVSGVVHGSVLQTGSIVGNVTVNAQTSTRGRWWGGRRPPGRDWLSGIDEWTEGLAKEVRKLWQREEENRRVHDPVALPVRWHPAVPELADHWANIRRLPAGAIAEPLALAGRIEQLAQIYRNIPSGRLVILGQAGAGKTVLASRLALDLFDVRRPGQPVPVIVSIGSWNPKTTSLHVWLTEQLTRDHPSLAALVVRGGPTRAGELIEAGRILPILDGFDEIDVGLHQAALRRLNTTPDVPMVLTSRTTEYAIAVHSADVLTAAAVIGLDDLTLEDLDDYLPRTAAGGSRIGIWNPVLRRVRTEPHALGPAALRLVLTNPLMVFLARTIYSDTPNRYPTELLDTHQFPTTQALQDHLLAAYIPAVYQADQRRRTPRWPADRAHRYLTYLATHLHKAGTRDLAWWQLRDTIPRPLRTLIFALLDGLLTGLALGTVIAIETRSWAAFVTGTLVLAFPVALASGLTVALTGGLTRTLRSQRHRGMPRFFSSKLTIALMVAFLVGIALMVVLVVAFLVGLMPESLYYSMFIVRSSIDLRDFSVPILMVCLAAGLPAGLAAGFIGLRSTGPQPTRTRLQIRGQARFIAGRFVAGFVSGLVFTAMVGLSFGTLLTQFGAKIASLLGRTEDVAGVTIFVEQLAVALPLGALGGLVFGLAAVILFSFEAPAQAVDAVRVVDSLSRDRRNTIRKMLAIWLPSVAVLGVVDSVETALKAAVVVGCLGFVWVRATSAWIYWLVLVRVWLPLTGRLPWRVQAFLTDAYQRGVLRQTGPVYQFRHARLQDHLITDTPTTIHTANS